jgi:naked cuticle
MQEFECDLSVEGGVDLGGQERQEFSFTLYDFDGHGKITKDVSLLNIKYICGCDN